MQTEIKYCDDIFEKRKSAALLLLIIIIAAGVSYLVIGILIGLIKMYLIRKRNRLLSEAIEKNEQLMLQFIDRLKCKDVVLVVEESRTERLVEYRQDVETAALLDQLQHESQAAPDRLRTALPTEPVQIVPQAAKTSINLYPQEQSTKQRDNCVELPQPQEMIVEIDPLK